jgi:hypothetical protein
LRGRSRCARSTYSSEFSDDRRFFVPALVPFVFFVLVIIIGGIGGGIVSLPMMLTRLQMCSGIHGVISAPVWMS